METNQKIKILIVDDDQDLNNLLKYTLESTKDYQVFSHFEGSRVQEIVREILPDLVLLDVMLPGLDGTRVLKQLRADRSLEAIPVVLLTARAQDADKVEGFESGADDYITKPFSPRELLLRVQAILRRASPGKTLSAAGSEEKSISIGPLCIFPELFKVLVDGETIVLTSTEFHLLLHLAERVGRLQSRELLLQKVWGYEGSLNTRTVDTHIKRLRQKLGTAGYLIETVHGFGYNLVEPGSSTHQRPQPSAQ
jgi:DNA-binding response OmpR family regulator